MRPLNHLTIPLCVPAIALVAASFPNCAVPCDQVDPTNPDCTMMTMTQSSDLSLLTNRLPKSGGRLSAQVKNLDPGAQVKATLGSGGPVVSFTLNADGSGSADVTGAQLTDIPLGALNVTLQVETQENVVRKSRTKTLHIYALPSYVDTMKATGAISGAQPSFVQISQGHVFDTEDSGTSRVVSEYQLAGTNLLVVKPRNTHRVPLAPDTILDINETKTVRLRAAASTNYTLEYQDLSSPTIMSYTALKMLSYTKAAALSTDRKSTMVAVAGEGTDGPLKAFTMPQGALASMPITVSGIPSGKSPVLVGWGDLNGDKLLDLVAVHADNSFGVYLQKAGQGLVYDETWSTGLGNAAALQGATPPAFAVGDTDRDGIDDVLIGQNMVISQLASEGDGTFSKTQLLSNLPVDSLGLGDVNGDSKLDLAIGQKQLSTITCYINQGP